MPSGLRDPGRKKFEVTVESAGEESSEGDSGGGGRRFEEFEKHFKKVPDKEVEEIKQEYGRAEREHKIDRAVQKGLKKDDGYMFWAFNSAKDIANSRKSKGGDGYFN